MSRKKKRTPPGSATVDYFAELRKAHPDRRVTCAGCDGTGEHAFWCERRSEQAKDE